MIAREVLDAHDVRGYYCSCGVEVNDALLHVATAVENAVREHIAAEIEGEANLAYEGGSGATTAYGRGAVDAFEFSARVARSAS